MINYFKIKNIATFKGEHKVENLKNYNYFFGSNGTGKTTVSSIIANATDLTMAPFSECFIKWHNDNQLETRVYNRCFVEENFGEQLKGVFTLGKESKEAQEQIKSKNEELDAIQTSINTFSKTLRGADGNGGKQKELTNLEEEYKEKFWKQKTKAERSPIQKGMQGVLNSQQKFKEKVLSELTNAADLLSLIELEKKANTVFDASLMEVSSIPVPDMARIAQLENESILKKNIVGKGDVDIAAMIKSLGNSDWVRQGKFYFESNNGICPFCQQEVSNTFEQSLESYFDKTFEEETTKISNLVSDYTKQASNIVNSLQILIDNPSLCKFLDIEQIKTSKQTFQALVAVNNQKLDKKQKEASQVIELDYTKIILEEIVKLIVDANKKIDENNAIVKNIQKEKTALAKQIWRYIISELQTDIMAYQTKKTNFEAAISSLNKQIAVKQGEKAAKQGEIRELEKKITSIQPTCDGINNLLASFGFSSFKLAVTADGKSYKMVREDGTDAKKTLSEGERNFVTFLYFCHLLRGSHSETGITSNKVVVIDDPVSSLDNDVLFIVSTLVREIIAQARDNGSDIKQVFVLTHNIYFHKEVTYNARRGNSALSEESFYIIKKRNKESIVENPNNNPIKTSYELLWDEIANPNCNKATIQNTMRRVLENYFKMLGNISFDDLLGKFDGDDKLKCKALLSWVNDGSHSALDEDYYTPLTDTEVFKFKDVFRQIFEKSDQLAHYNMMVRCNN